MVGKSKWLGTFAIVDFSSTGDGCNLKNMWNREGDIYGSKVYQTSIRIYPIANRLTSPLAASTLLAPDGKPAMFFRLTPIVKRYTCGLGPVLISPEFRLQNLFHMRYGYTHTNSGNHSSISQHAESLLRESMFFGVDVCVFL